MFCHLAYVCIGSILRVTGQGPSHWDPFCCTLGWGSQFLSQGPSCETLKRDNPTVPALPYILEPVLHFAGAGPLVPLTAPATLLPCLLHTHSEGGPSMPLSCWNMGRDLWLGLQSC